MKRELSFLNGSKNCEMFRPNDLKYSEYQLTKEDLKDVTTGAGVYIIVAADGKTKFVYPNGLSPIIYIGKSDHLRRRLMTHLKNKSQCEMDKSCSGMWCMRYEYMRAFGAKIYVITKRGKQEAKNLEAKILWMFYNRYRSLPVGNGARSFDNR